MSYLIYLFAILQLADIYTTHMILKRGGKELNPVLAKLFDMFDYRIVLVIVKAAAIYVVAVVCEPYPEIIGLLCLFYAFIVWRNCKVIN